MQAASLLDGFSFDLFPPFENGPAAPEVDVSRRQVVQALVVSTVVVVADELLDALFELSWQVVVVQQDPVFHRAMISLDLALRHRVVRPDGLHQEGGIEALVDGKPRPRRIWNKIPDKIETAIINLALEEPDLSPRELAVNFTDTKGSFVSEATVYRLLKDHGLITSPAFILMKAAD